MVENVLVGIKFLPINIIFMLQPMDGKHYATSKQLYRKHLLQSPEDNDVTRVLAFINKMNPKYWYVNAWDSVETLSLK